MIYVCIKQEIKRVQDLLVNEFNEIETFDCFKPKLWIKAVLYAADLNSVDNTRKVDGLAKRNDLQFMLMYLNSSGKLPKYLAVENEKELQLFQSFLKEAIYVAAVNALEDEELSFLTKYDLY